MQIMSENIYFECRKRAAISNDRLKSRAGAAEYLGISESSLTHYELGIAKNIPVDVVVMMAELYNAPELKYHYCKTECPIGKAMPLATAEKPLAVATIHLLDSLNMAELDAYSSRLLRIASDGEISNEEREEVKSILAALDKVSTAVSELRIIMDKHGEGAAADGTR